MALNHSGHTEKLEFIARCCQGCRPHVYLLIYFFPVREEECRASASPAHFLSFETGSCLGAEFPGLGTACDPVSQPARAGVRREPGSEPSTHSRGDLETPGWVGEGREVAKPLQEAAGKPQVCNRHSSPAQAIPPADLKMGVQTTPARRGAHSRLKVGTRSVHRGQRPHACTEEYYSARKRSAAALAIEWRDSRRSGQPWPCGVTPHTEETRL